MWNTFLKYSQFLLPIAEKKKQMRTFEKYVLLDAPTLHSLKNLIKSGYIVENIGNDIFQ